MKSYPSYKDSGVECIGEIPSGWDVKHIAILYSESSIRGHEDEENLSVFRDYGVVRREDHENKNVLSEDLSNYKLVKKGDLVLNKMKTWMGSIGVSDYQGIVSPAYYVLSPNFQFFTKYLHHLLRSKAYIDQYASLSKGIRPGQWDLNIREFKSLKVLLPSIQEQQQIANYLDEKTTQINSLIEKIERKIELLKEQRTALINQAVTKGLDPNVEMKDSGVEWIGEIPDHWSVGSMKYLLSENNGGVWGSDPDNQDLDVVVIRSTEITIDGNWNLESPVKRKLSDRDHDKCKLQKNDIVITKSSGSPDHIGKSVIVTQEVEDIDCCYSNFVQRIRFERENPVLYHYILNSYVVRDQYRYLTHSTTGLGNLSGSTINNVQLPFIPLKEQQQIANYLDEKTTQIDSIIEKETKRIELLKEYRQSLISNVVTGKVRVVEEVAI